MLKILGDINLADWYFDIGNGVGTSISKGADPFCHLDRRQDDFWIGNLECVCAESFNKTFPFVQSPKSLSHISPLNLYGVANNHVMQMGIDGYNQTLDYLNKNGIMYAGSNSRKFVFFMHQGKKIGLMAFSQRPDNFCSNPLYWHLPEYAEIINEINLMHDCDYKIAFIHWGYEFINYPNIDQKLLGHCLIDNGIDLVVGMHPHVSQGMEIYKDKYIFYSLGNSVFNMNWEPTKYGLLVSVDLKYEKPVVNVDYLHIDYMGFPEIIKEVPYIYSMKYLNSLINTNIENEKYFLEAKKKTSKYRRVNHKAIIKDILLAKSPYAKKIIIDFINRRFLKK